MREADDRNIGVGAQRLAERLRVDGGAPWVFEPHDLDAEGRSDRRGAFPKNASNHHERPIARREQIHDRRLEPTSARAGEAQNLVLGREDAFEPGAHLGEQGFELGATVVDHLVSQGRTDGVRHRDRPGDP